MIVTTPMPTLAIPKPRAQEPPLNEPELARLLEYALQGKASLKRDGLDFSLWRKGYVIPTTGRMPGIDSLDMFRRAEKGEHDLAMSMWVEADISTKGMLVYPDRIEPSWRLRHAIQEFMNTATESDTPNQFPPGADDKYGSWDSMIEAGKSYMVGDQVPTAAFIRTHRRSMKEWQVLAFYWALRNPTKRLVVQSGGCIGRRRPERDWNIYVRGEMVCFDLPHHDAGGEKSYVTQTGRSMIQVNED